MQLMDGTESDFSPREQVNTQSRLLILILTPKALPFLIDHKGE